jgi:Tol biopolymer transport system component
MMSYVSLQKKTAVLVVFLLLSATAVWSAKIEAPVLITEDQVFAPEALFEWHSVTDAAHYHVQILRMKPGRPQWDGKRIEGLLLVEAPATVETALNLLSLKGVRIDRTYFVRVCAYNTRGKKGRWTDAIPVIIKVPGPALTGPPSTINTTRRPQYEWTAPNLDDYLLEFQLSHDPEFRTLDKRLEFNRKEAMTRGWKPDFDHVYEKPYYLRARTAMRYRYPGENDFSIEQSDWTPVHEFIVKYFLPKIISPKENLTVYTLNPEFVFTHSSAPTAWQIQVAPDGDFREETLLWDFMVTNDAGTRTSGDVERGSFTYPLYFNLEPNKQYWWRLRSYYSEEEKTLWTSPGSFRLPRQGEEPFRATRIEKTLKEHEVFPSFSPDGAKIAYNSFPASQQTDPFLARQEDAAAPVDIYLRDIRMIDGRFAEVVAAREHFTAPTQTPFGPSRDLCPRWFPDSSALTFCTNRYNVLNSVVKKYLDSSAMTILVQPAQDEQVLRPAVSPDGRFLSMTVRRKKEPPRVWICNAATGGGLTDLFAGDLSTFSPDGQKLAYVHNIEGHDKIWIYDLERGVNTQLNLGKATSDFQYPAFRPDGSYLTYASNEAGNWDVFYYSFHTERSTQVTNSLAEDTMPVFSPDGQRIIFASKRDNSNFDLWHVEVPLPPVAVPMAHSAEEEGN